MKANALRLTVSRMPGETSLNHTWRQRLLNGSETPASKVQPEKLLADMIKREARAIMSNITECAAEQIPAHLGRLGFLRELIHHATRNELIPGAETRLSGRQLLFAHTVADFAAALEITKQTHRAPAFLNQRDADIAEINRPLDLLAGLFARSPAVEAVLNESIAADLQGGGL